MTFFNGWHWYLACKGYTSLELLDAKKRVFYYEICNDKNREKNIK